jgi:hypothetical protein
MGFTENQIVDFTKIIIKELLNLFSKLCHYCKNHVINLIHIKS